MPGTRFCIMEYSEVHHRMNAGAFLHDCFESLGRSIEKYTLHGEDGRLIDLRQTMMGNGVRAGSVITIRSIADESVVFVKTLAGKTVRIEVDLHTDTGADLKRLLYKLEGIPPDQQRLIFAGRQFEDHDLLSSFGVKPESTITLFLRLRGG
ncbi:putative Ubiquitin-60S ribosomal protein L40 [Blattamonas nauphoetae]|uniref:Ubiquitin-60S ribosomal protein L40 n=1 Tax=Blattamonas nauphoetae TaxID=2049346 RepID=A0ABQ9XVA2_9EUKA|nr:putative Ubiquitin-60S ribosomal protein L40 [Blattamonas nauphoetae]